MYVCVQLHCESARSFILLLNIVAIKASNLNFPFKNLAESGSESWKILSLSCSAARAFY